MRRSLPPSFTMTWAVRQALRQMSMEAAAIKQDMECCSSCRQAAIEKKARNG